MRETRAILPFHYLPLCSCTSLQARGLLSVGIPALLPRVQIFSSLSHSYLSKGSKGTLWPSFFLENLVSLTFLLDKIILKPRPFSL